MHLLKSLSHNGHLEAGLIEHRWWTQPDLTSCRDKLLPPNLSKLLADILNGAVLLNN